MTREDTVLVLGGGVAGMTAAIELAKMGRKVHLVEKRESLGGLVADLSIAGPGHEPHEKVIEHLIKGVMGHEGITVHTSSTVAEVSGKARDFQVRLEGRTGADLQVGAIILATGARTFDPTRLPEYKYDRTPSIITSLELEAIVSGGKTPVHPDTGRQLTRVGFVQCIGSRMDTRGNPWCSNICCNVSIKQSLLIKERSPDTDVIIFYMDIRAFGRGDEELYSATKRKGVRFSRGIPSEILVRKDGSLVVRAEDASLGKVIERDLDLLVLAVGLEPGEDTAFLAEALGLERSVDGFFPVVDPEHSSCSTGTEGILVAGTAEFPKSIRNSVLQARSAALEADRLLSG